MSDQSTMFDDVMELLGAMDGSESDLRVNENFGSESDGTSGDAVDVERVESAPKPRQKTPLKPKRPKKRKQGPVPYTTELQRRKRNELLTLRQEAAALNGLLVQLHDRRHTRLAITAEATGAGSSNGWRNLAAIECEERQRAERTNRELKVILANQQKTAATIRKLLGKHDILEGQEYVFHLKSPIERFPSRLDCSDAILGDLSTGLESLRIDAGHIFPAPESNNCAVVSRCEDKRHGTNGHRVSETTTITPLTCSIQKAADLLWRVVSTDCDASFHSIRKSNPQSFEMNCVARSEDGPQNIDGVVIYRRYDESDRIVIVGSSTWFLSTRGLQFEDSFWTVISPSQSDPLHACIVQTRYRLQAKITDPESVLPTDFKYAENAVMSSIGMKLRNAMQALQNLLISEAELGTCRVVLN